MGTQLSVEERKKGRDGGREGKWIIIIQLHRRTN